MAAPSGTPDAILERLSGAFADAAAAPDWRTRFVEAQGLVPMPGGREAFAAVLREDGARSAARLRSMHLRLD